MGKHTKRRRINTWLVLGVAVLGISLAIFIGGMEKTGVTKTVTPVSPSPSVVTPSQTTPPTHVTTPPISRRPEATSSPPKPTVALQTSKPVPPLVTQTQSASQANGSSGLIRAAGEFCSSTQTTAVTKDGKPLACTGGRWHSS